MKKSLNISVVGSGYVGMAMAVLLSQKNNVKIYDIDEDRIEKINKKKSTIKDNLIQEFLDTKNLSLKGTSNINDAFKDAEVVIIATPTDYDEDTNKFDTSSVDSTVSEILKRNKESFIVIKSTMPIGHTKHLIEKHNYSKICFSPEFLREGNALYDNLFPSRIIMGSNNKAAREFSKVLKSAASNKDFETLFVKSEEAEAIKLFSNSYLALRVAFFNELDSFCLKKDLNSKNIIDGISLDKRIGSGYNNPSFGYGGYCLPKDTKQLLSNFKDVPQDIIGAIVNSNETRKDFIANIIFSLNIETVGFYRLSMKKGSDNYRFSAVLDIIKKLQSKGKRILIYEPILQGNSFCQCEVIKDKEDFLASSDLIIANRISSSLKDFEDKVFTRDIYNRD